MEKHELYLTITSVAKPVFSGAVRSVTLPAAEGVMTILPKHEAFVSTLKPGVVHVTTAEGSEEFEIHGGIIEVADNTATVLL